MATDTNPDRTILSLEEFEDHNYDELSAIFAETGADREMDFDRDEAIESIYNNPNSYPQMVRSV